VFDDDGRPVGQLRSLELRSGPAPLAGKGLTVDRAVKDRWLTESDGRKIKAELTADVATSPAASSN